MPRVSLVLLLLALALGVVGYVVEAFACPGATRSKRAIIMMKHEEVTPTTTTTTTTRTDLLKGGAAFLVSSFLLNPTPAASWARGLPSGPSKAELLEKTRSKSTEDPAEKKARLAQERKERLERQKQLDAEEEARKKDPNRKQAEIDANLRSNYYYPTGNISRKTDNSSEPQQRIQYPLSAPLRTHSK